MPQCKALKTFNSTQYGYIRAGSRFSSEPQYAQDLKRQGLIEIIHEPMRPARNQAIEQAPALGNDEPAGQVQQPGKFVSVGQPVDGEETQSPSLRVGRASPRPTATTSKGNAKR